MGIYDRQSSRATTASAPAGKSDSKTQGDGKAKRAGRYVKKSVADFFGLGDDDVKHSERWNNRRLRYYKGKVKDDYMPKGDEDYDASPIKYIHDPLKMPGRSEISSRRTTPLSSTSTYGRSFSRPGAKRMRKDSVLKMTWKGLSTIASSRKKLRGKPSLHSRSYAPASLAAEHDDLSVSFPYPPHDDAFSLVDDVFYDEPSAPPDKMERIGEEPEYELPGRGWRRPPPKALPSTPYDEIDMPEFGMRRIADPVMNSIIENEKRQIGMGFVGRLFNRSFRSDRMNSYVKTQIDNIDDHRPYFTYWVTFVQVLIFIVSVAVYGLAPIGVGETKYTETVMMPNLAFEAKQHTVKDNLWIGPTQADLIHLGAKYSPCMRKDENIQNAIDLDRAEEKTSGCCIRDDGSGCRQTVQTKCSATISSFIKWNSTNKGTGGYESGAVCGQDPNYCKDPLSVAPFEWDKTDLTKWPVCKDTNKPLTNTTITTQDRHMSCEISGRPCCFGIQGECMITTREHCNFIKGYYHDDKFLCSQVECLGQICGMIEFSDPTVPDQFYRLWTSMFLHGGLFHLVITIGFQFLIMRDIEKLTGCIRLAIIYLGSGVAGNLASSIFLPYHVEVGPAGAQFGILACLFVEVLQSFQMLKRPFVSLLKVGGFIIFLFILGFLPWIDNWAHLSGFLFGFLLAFSLLPYVSFGKFDRRRKLIGIILSLGGATVLFVLLVILFYVLPLYDCPGCQYFNCIPFTDDFCKNMEVSIDRKSTYSTYL